MIKIKNPKKKKNTRQEQSKQGPLIKLNVGSGAMEESASSVDRSQPLCCVFFVVIEKTEKSVDNPVISNGLTISMKH